VLGLKVVVSTPSAVNTEREKSDKGATKDAMRVMMGASNENVKIERADSTEEKAVDKAPFAAAAASTPPAPNAPKDVDGCNDGDTTVPNGPGSTRAQPHWSLESIEAKAKKLKQEDRQSKKAAASTKEEEKTPGQNNEGGSNKKKKRGSHDELARQVNRFSHEELEYLEDKFHQYPTPNMEQREHIAKELSSRRIEKELNIKDLGSRSDFSYIKGQGLMPTELTQVQIKYWFDHQRRKMKKMKMSHAQFTQGVAFNKTRGEKGCVAAFINSPQMLSYGPTGPHMARIHQNKSPGAASDGGGGINSLQRPSPTGVLPQTPTGVDAVCQTSLQKQQQQATVAALGQLSGFGSCLNFGQQMGGQPVSAAGPASLPFCMPMVATSTLPITPPPPGTNPAAAAVTSRVQSPLPMPQSADMAKYWQMVMMMQNSTSSKVKPQYKVASWQAFDTILPRGTPLDKGIYVISGKLRVSYYGSKEDPAENPAHYVDLPEGGFVGATGTKSSQPGLEMMIQAQMPCSCALVEPQLQQQ